MLKNKLKQIFTSFFRKQHLKRVAKQSINKNEKILERLGDEADYDGMGNYGRFPPIKK
tara:strand:+ start:320 stop:493 length:174 start_codon:yes stop_codon:yes gene_type:complete